MRNKYRFVLTCMYGYNILEDYVRNRLKKISLHVFRES